MSGRVGRGVIGLLLVAACGLLLGGAPATPLIAFADALPASGISFRLDNSATPRKHQIETMLGGVAVLDYDNDGRLDLYFTNGARLPHFDKSEPRFHNRLYRNQGDGTFTDVTTRAGVQGTGYGMGVAAADYDNDGLTDLYVVGIRQNQLFRNRGDGTFTNVVAQARDLGSHPTLGQSFAVSAGWFDYDRDGWLDLMVIQYVQWSLESEPACTVRGVRTYCAPDRFEGLPNVLFHNNRDGTFTDVSERSGIGRHVGKGMGLAFADYDQDGHTDVFVANDTFRHFLFRNRGDGTFAEAGITAGVAYGENGKEIAGMGAEFRDIDNDGRPDVFVTGMHGDTFPLYRNQGTDFLDVTGASGVARATAALTGWGNGAYDFDNDGRKDLFTANAAILDNAELVDRLPFRLRNTVLRNLGGWRFADLSPVLGPSWAAGAHRGAAFGDLDNDGRVDVVTTSLNEPPKLLLNRSPGRHHWLTCKLVGTRSNRDGLGAIIRVTTADNVTQVNHATTSVGYSSSSDARVHFGLGSHTVAKTVEVRWPGGRVQVLEQVPANQILTVREP